MMPHTPLRILPLSAAVLLLAIGSGQCCSSASASASAAATAQPSAHAVKGATEADTPKVKAAKADSTNTQAAPQLDMDTLIERLKKTTAIGMLTKLVLRSNVNDLIDEVKRYKRVRGAPSQLEKIRAHFNGLLLKVLALLKDDPKLAEDIQCARTNLWQHLMEVKA